MQVQAISTCNNQTNFGAKISIVTDDMKLYMDYLGRYTKAEKPCYNSARDLELTNKIFDAFEKHPSKEVIIPDVAYFRDTLFNARGTIESSRAAFIDTEPARSDSGTAPIFNIFRRILDPENKKQFNKLVGEEYAPVYESWWQENISPIWEDINNNFREQTFFKKNYDKKFNNDFNRESGKYEDFFKQTGNFWVKLYNKLICN
jgi:hypothetical protein